ncbi:MAG: AraC family transcriptional regulator [Acidobacteriota bacterium]
MRDQKFDGYLYGKIERKIEINEFLLAETAYTSQLVLPAHTHKHAYFCLVLDGTFTEQYENKKRFCGPSTIIFHPSGELHSDQFGIAGGRCFNFQTGNSWLARIRDYSRIFESPSEYRGGKLVQLATRLYREFRLFDTVSPLAIESLALEIIVAASRQAEKGSATSSPNRLKRVREFLQENFSERLTLDQIAKSVDIHPVHLARIFRANYGCTVGEYLRHLRIDAAVRELASSNTPIIDIAFSVGFSSQSHFSTTFKRLIGMTPVEYRTIFRPR